LYLPASWARRDPPTRRLASLTDARGNTWRVTYDAPGNKLAVIYPNSTAEYAANYTTSGLAQAFTNRRGQT